VPLASPPFYHVTLFCGSNYFHVWISLLYAYIASIVFLVAVFAILTRKIKVEHFKDTKKVNMFVFISIATLTICFSYSTIFAQVGIIHAAYTFEVLQYLSVAILCQVFLFMPKIWSARHEKQYQPQLATENGVDTISMTVIHNQD